ncbi:hypothetical protein O181_029761 [Austropuccinia psidii MF-1]|uniref:Uncharacterized protein n=1 Tax=Austropuccinia psidii MF-1 TaxID=1389203 RepID=A0A9Q3H3L4_9BASI|nr:hypothetical protein [Austropuccinia psidii MF-1]
MPSSFHSSEYHRSRATWTQNLLIFLLIGSSTAMKRKAPSIAGESQEIKDVMQQQPKPFFSDAPPQPLCEMEGSSGPAQGFFEINVRFANNGVSTHAEVESMDTHQRVSFLNSKHIAESSSTPEDSNGTQLQVYMMMRPLVSDFVAKAVKLIEVLLPMEAQKISKSSIQGNWKTLGEIIGNHPLGKDPTNYFFKKNKTFRLPNYKVRNSQTPNHRRNVLYYANHFAGDLLLQKLGLKEQEAQLLTELHKKWHLNGVTSNLPLVFNAIDYVNKVLPVKLSRLNECFSTPPFCQADLADLQKSAFYSLGRIWKDAEVTKIEESVKTNVAPGDEIFAPVFSYLFGSITHKEDLIRFSWLVFQAWISKYQPRQAERIFKNNHLMAIVKETIGDMEVVEAIGNLNLEVAYKLF